LVEEELPLKQGLKHHYYNSSYYNHLSVEEELPLKQGLKLAWINDKMKFSWG